MCCGVGTVSARVAPSRSAVRLLAGLSGLQAILIDTKAPFSREESSFSRG